MKPAKQDASYEDVVRSPAEMVAELVDGALYLRSRRHDYEHLGEALCSTYLVKNAAWRSPEFRWQPASGPLLQLGDDLLSPEACAWASREVPPHHKLQSGERHVQVFKAAPAWVLELVTPETAKLVREKKLPAYLRAGVSTVWLLDPEARRCEVLIAESGAWNQHQVCGEHGAVRLRPFECEELNLEEFWDTREQRAEKVRGIVEELGRALDDALARGVSEDALFTMLLKTLDVRATLWDEDVAVAMLGSESLLLRARALVSFRTPIRQARQVAREELAGEHDLRELSPSERDALCERYCELLETEGPGSSRVRELAPRAHAWARYRIDYWWHPRQGPQMALSNETRNVAKPDDLSAFAETGKLSDRARSFVMNGPDAWRSKPEDWGRALAAVIAELEVAPPLHDARIDRLIATLTALLPDRDDDVRRDARNARSLKLEAEREADDVFSRLRLSSPERERRPMEDDVALEWRIMRRELALEMAELRETGRLPSRLNTRLATGEGMTLLSDEEQELVDDAFFRDLRERLDEPRRSETQRASTATPDTQETT